MDELLDAVAELVCLVSPEKIQAIAGRIRRTEACKALLVLPGAVGTPKASNAIASLSIALLALGVPTARCSRTSQGK